MKKKKVPIIPIIVLAILFGFVGYTQMPKSAPTPDAPPPAKDEDKSAVAKDVGGQIDTSKIKDVPTAKTRGAMSMHQQSSLILPDPSIAKPKPNNSSIANQWYEKDASKQ